MFIYLYQTKKIRSIKNSMLHNNIQINSEQIIVITFHSEHKIIVKRNNSDLNNGELK